MVPDNIKPREVQTNIQKRPKELRLMQQKGALYRRSRVGHDRGDYYEISLVRAQLYRNVVRIPSITSVNTARHIQLQSLLTARFVRQVNLQWNPAPQSAPLAPVKIKDSCRNQQTSMPGEAKTNKLACRANTALPVHVQSQTNVSCLKLHRIRFSTHVVN